MGGGGAVKATLILIFVKIGFGYVCVHIKYIYIYKPKRYFMPELVYFRFILSRSELFCVLLIMAINFWSDIALIILGLLSFEWK